MKIVIFYVQDLSFIGARFLEKTGEDIIISSQLIIENRLPYDGWYVKVIY